MKKKIKRLHDSFYLKENRYKKIKIVLNFYLIY